MDVKVTSLSFGSSVDGYGFCAEVRRSDVADHTDGKYYYQICNLNPRLTVVRTGGAGNFAQLECRIEISELDFAVKDSFGVTIIPPQTECDILLPFNNFVPLGKIEPKKATLEIDILDKGQVVFSGQLPVAFVNLPTGVC